MRPFPHARTSPVSDAFRNLKGDLGLRTIFHHRADRIASHRFVAFLALRDNYTLPRLFDALSEEARIFKTNESQVQMLFAVASDEHHRGKGFEVESFRQRGR